MVPNHHPAGPFMAQNLGFQRQLVRPNKRHGNPLRLQTEAPSWLFQVPKASAFGSLDWVKRTS